MKAKVITFAHNKGGTGKTSSCISIAGFLAKNDKKVLLVDMDSQGNAVSGLGIDKDSLNGTMIDVMNKKTNIKNIILKTDTENIHLAPNRSNLIQRDNEKSKNKSILLLDNSLKNIKRDYDYILIDTPPNQGNLIVNAALASDEVILVSDPGIFALEAIQPLKRELESYSKKTGKKIKMDTAILTKCKNSLFSFLNNNNPSDEVAEELQKLYKNVFSVPYSDKIYESQVNGTPISHFNPRSDVGISYEKIAEAIS